MDKLKQKINFKKINLLYLIIFTIITIIIVIVKPFNKWGEYENYVFMTAALMYERTIYFSEQTIKNIESEFPKYKDGNINRFINKTFPIVKSNGKMTSHYFPGYSASCIPIAFLIKSLKLDQSYTFCLTNIFLLLISLICVYRYLNINDKIKLFLILSLTINPILYYLFWASVEVFIYSFIIISMVFLYNKSYKRSAFFFQ